MVNILNKNEVDTYLKNPNYKKVIEEFLSSSDNCYILLSNIREMLYLNAMARIDHQLKGMLQFILDESEKPCYKRKRATESLLKHIILRDSIDRDSGKIEQSLAQLIEMNDEEVEEYVNGMTKDKEIKGLIKDVEVAESEVRTLYAVLNKVAYNPTMKLHFLEKLQRLYMEGVPIKTAGDLLIDALINAVQDSKLIEPIKAQLLSEEEISESERINKFIETIENRMIERRKQYESAMPILRLCKEWLKNDLWDILMATKYYVCKKSVSPCSEDIFWLSDISIPRIIEDFQEIFHLFEVE